MASRSRAWAFSACACAAFASARTRLSARVAGLADDGLPAWARAGLEGADLASADLAGADLEPGDFEPADLEPVDVELADLELADLELADLEPAAPLARFAPALRTRERPVPTNIGTSPGSRRWLPHSTPRKL